ncbi:hypothetical protein M408DRAFT_29771 [Serendipita vermifera MAFF 305830]|uniref:F-box domain-containing protein n=1 Tax=Serendipita vermifera MAFF 305830 TaxID=933852 RepID=A0A0C3APK4_SERVB|nr:hypothetical protein M408DRAFT_29771 [Serendipita vermifera MAFF 305830]
MGTSQSKGNHAKSPNQRIPSTSNVGTLDLVSTGSFEYSLKKDIPSDAIIPDALSARSETPHGLLGARRRRRGTPPQHPTPLLPVTKTEDFNAPLMVSMLEEYIRSGESTDHRFRCPGYNMIPYSIRRIEDIDTDVIIEILRHYIAMQNDGTFILTMVSKTWRDFVLQSPTLWQWITIDEISPDCTEKSIICSTLAASHPLQIVVQLPITDWTHLATLVPCAQNIFFEIPEYMTETDAKEETCTFLANPGLPATCQVHWCHIGGKYINPPKPWRPPSPDITSPAFWADRSRVLLYYMKRNIGDLRMTAHGWDF